MKRIPLTQGKVAFVSDRDWPVVRQFKWYAVKTSPRGKWYACAHPTAGSPIYLHRLITGGRWREVDHWNGDGLDNRRRNLRGCMKFQNMCNRGKTRANTSGYKGVFKTRKRWFARIIQNKIIYHLGVFSNKREAGLAYAKAARRLHGRFARTK